MGGPGVTKPGDIDSVWAADEAFLRSPEDNNELPAWAKGETRSRLDLARTRIDTGKKIDTFPRPVTDKGKDKLKQRGIEDIFDGDPDTRKEYIDGVRKALETIDPDTLHQFILDHKLYGKSNYVGWNKDLARLLDFTPRKQYLGKTKAHTNRRICWAMQEVLVAHYNTDVFQLTKKKINPWIFIDGKLGPYTVCVLSAYWTNRFGSTSSRTPNPPGIADINDTYLDDGEAAKKYDEALVYLGGQLGASETAPDQNPPEGDPKDHLAEDVQADLEKAVKEKDYKKLDMALATVILGPASKVFSRSYNDIREALSDFFGEAIDTPRESKRLYRTLHYLEKVAGKQALEDMRIQTGDRIEITADYTFKLTHAGMTLEYNLV